MNEPVEGSFADKLAKALGRKPDIYANAFTLLTPEEIASRSLPRKVYKPKALSVGYGKDNK